MIGPELARMLNTLYGWAAVEDGVGESLCVPCGRELQNNKWKAPDGYEPITGADYFNAGQDPADPWECARCGAVGDVDEYSFEQTDEDTISCRECKSAEGVTPFATCDSCGKRLEDGKEE